VGSGKEDTGTGRNRFSSIICRVTIRGTVSRCAGIVPSRNPLRRKGIVVDEPWPWRSSSFNTALLDFARRPRIEEAERPDRLHPSAGRTHQTIAYKSRNHFYKTQEPCSAEAESAILKTPNAFNRMRGSIRQCRPHLDVQMPEREQPKRAITGKAQAEAKRCQACVDEAIGVEPTCRNRNRIARTRRMPRSRSTPQLKI